MEPRNHQHEDDSCCNCKAGDSTRQTLTELDFERGIWSAAQSNELSRVRKLLDRGTSPDAEDAAGYTGLQYAARNGHEEVCRELLSRGAQVDARTRSGQATALQRASTQGRERVARLLLNAGADPNAQDADGYTALHRAVLATQERLARLLIPMTRPDLRDSSSRTPRELAEARGCLEWFSD